MLSAEAGDDGAALPLLVLDAEAGAEAARDVEAEAALGLGALEGAPFVALADVATLGEPVGGDAVSGNLVYQSDYEIGSTTPSGEANEDHDMMMVIPW